MKYKCVQLQSVCHFPKITASDLRGYPFIRLRMRQAIHFVTICHNISFLEQLDFYVSCQLEGGIKKNYKWTLRFLFTALR